MQLVRLATCLSLAHYCSILMSTSDRVVTGREIWVFSIINNWLLPWACVYVLTRNKKNIPVKKMCQKPVIFLGWADSKCMSVLWGKERPACSSVASFTPSCLIYWSRLKVYWRKQGQRPNETEENVSMKSVLKFSPRLSSCLIWPDTVNLPPAIC